MNFSNILIILSCFFIIISCQDEKHKINAEDLRKGLVLQLSDQAFNTIKEKREKALAENFLIKSKTDYVNGFLLANNKKIAVKARLKGDFVDHLKGERWSFRIVARDSGTILNHQRFSIQGIHTRAYINEWIFHQLCEQENIVSLQYDFYPFSVNDTLAGIYAFESYFDNYLLDRAGRQHGPILKFNEDDFWGNLKYKGQPDRDDKMMIEARVKICNKVWCKQDENKDITKKAKRLLVNYRLGKIPYDSIFDTNLWAKYVAINEIMSSPHGLRWHNLRLYFNPISQKFEPISFDSGSWMPKDRIVYHYTDKIELFHKMMFVDDNYIAKINSELTRMCQKPYLEDFFERHESKISELEAMAKREKENYNFFKGNYYFSQNRILEQLERKKNSAPI